MELTQKLATIQTKLKAKKSRFNKFGNYYYRSAEDILEALKPFLLELDVTVTTTEELISNDPSVIQSTATIRDNLNELSATAVVGVDVMFKGQAMPQRYGTASSYAKKYALGNLFLIDDTADADATTNSNNNWVPSGVYFYRLKAGDFADQKKMLILYQGATEGMENLPEIVKKYEVDGLHLDYIRFPNEPPATPRDSGIDYPYDARTLALYKADTGRTPDDDSEAWSQWRTDQVTRLVGDIHTMLRRTKPHAALTASVGSVRERALRHHQDGRAWMERGIIDAAILMDYTDSPEEFGARIDPWLAYAVDVPVVPGLWFGRHRDVMRLRSPGAGCQDRPPQPLKLFPRIHIRQRPPEEIG